MELIQHVYQFKLPMTFQPVEDLQNRVNNTFWGQKTGTPRVNRNQSSHPNRFVNVYMIEGSEGNLLIDTGINSAESYNTLAVELKNYGFSIKDIKYIVITHSHFDHCGQAGKIKQLTGANIYISQKEMDNFQNHYIYKDEGRKSNREILQECGVPQNEIDNFANVFKRDIDNTFIFSTEFIVKTGDIIPVDHFEFSVIETPGHSAGHICLYERNKKLLFTGDLILPEITPNIGIYPGQTPNPLGVYLQSLEEIYNLEVNLAFPGHGPAFSGVRQLIESIVRHHNNRNNAILNALEGTGKSAYQIAQEIPWLDDINIGNFNNMNILDKRLAIGEAASHLEYLAAEGKIAKIVEDGVIIYYG